MRILLRSNGNTPRTYEKQFRLDGSNAAWPFEHLPKHALAWWRSPSDLPCSLTATGSICRLNPDTASGHTVAETYAAPLRRVLRSGLAMLARKRLSGILSQQKEKFGSLQRGEIKCFGYAQVCEAGCKSPNWRVRLPIVHSASQAVRHATGNQPFLFLPLFRVAPKQNGVVGSPSLLGGFFCFRPLLSLLLYLSQK